MKKNFLVTLILIVLSVVLAGQEKLPQLVKTAGETKDFPGSSHLMIFDKTEVKMMDSGLSHVTKEALYKVLTADGGKRLKALEFGYDPMSAYVEVKAAKIIKKCGKEIDLPLDRVKDYPAPARAIYWGAREKLLPIGRLEPGDGLWVKTYQKGFTYALLYNDEDDRYVPPMKGHFYDIVPFYSEDIPILKKTYQVSIPADKRFQFQFYNGEARHYSHVKGDRNVYFWEKKNIKPIKYSRFKSDPSDFAPKLLVSTSPDWQAKSLWFHKVNEDFGSFEYDDEIKAKTDEIIRGSKDDWDKISRLTHWVAEEIRYSGISMGEGEGFTLHKGTMTFADRCGVCKDKAGMLITMLRAAGFESYPAMTMAGSRIDRIPADQFNHCVTLVKVKEQYHLLDPTWVPGVRELWSSAEQQQEYLMGVPEGADLKSTPISPPEKHYLKFKIDARISKEGHLTAAIQMTAEGQSDSNVRRLFTRDPVEIWPQILQEQFFSLHPDAEISNLTYQDPYDISKPFKIVFNVQVKNYLPMQGNEMILAPLSSSLPFSSRFFFHRMSFPETRKHPFDIRSSQMIQIAETLKLPPGLKPIKPGAFEKVDGSGASFSGNVKIKKNTLLIDKKILLKKRVYQPEDWPAFKKSVEQFRKLDGGILVTTRGGKK